ncbi:hypothetical protein V2J09_012932 [Rumex salicifolius]
MATGSPGDLDPDIWGNSNLPIFPVHLYLVLSKLSSEEQRPERDRSMAFPRIQVRRGELRIHENLSDLSVDLVEYISELSEASVKERGAFAIAISGGSLVGLMSKLSEAPYNRTIDWAKWCVYWADERVVAKTHVDSNYRLAKECLFSKVPIIPSHVHSINDSLSAEEAANEYEFSIRQLVRTRVIDVSDTSDCPKFDLILLGMGPDCHVASLFPNHPALSLKHEWVTYITDSPKPPPERITFTLPVINSASNVALVVTGASKAEAARLAISDAGPTSLPVRMVDPVEGKLVWFLDLEAASRIEYKKPIVIDMPTMATGTTQYCKGSSLTFWATPFFSDDTSSSPERSSVPMQKNFIIILGINPCPAASNSSFASFPTFKQNTAVINNELNTLRLTSLDGRVKVNPAEDGGTLASLQKWPKHYGFAFDHFTMIILG